MVAIIVSLEDPRTFGISNRPMAAAVVHGLPTRGAPGLIEQIVHAHRSTFREPMGSIVTRHRSARASRVNAVSSSRLRARASESVVMLSFHRGYLPRSHLQHRSIP